MTAVPGEALADRIRPCGPTLEAPGLETLRAQLVEADLGPVLDTAWPSLAPVFAASPYLASLARRRPEALGEMLTASPEATLAAILMRTAALTGGTDAMKCPLRLAKADLHLLTALADLGGVWARSPGPCRALPMRRHRRRSGPSPMICASGAGWSPTPIRTIRSPACSAWPWASTARMS